MIKVDSVVAKIMFPKSKMTEITIINTYVTSKNFKEELHCISYYSIETNKGKYIRDSAETIQDGYAVFYNTPFNVEDEWYTDAERKVEIEDWLLSVDIIPKGLLVLGRIQGGVLSEKDITRIDVWLKKPDNVSFPDETIQSSVSIIQETGNCSIVSMMLLLLNNDIFRLSEAKFRENTYISDACPLGSAEASSTLNWTPETNNYTTYVKSWSEMITKLGYKTTFSDSVDFDVSKSTDDVVIRVGGENNPLVSLGEYRLIGIIATHKSTLLTDGHAIPIVSLKQRWWVIDSNRSNLDRDGKMYPLPDLLTKDGTHISGTNYTLNFRATNIQSVVQINLDSTPSINGAFGYDVFPGKARNNFYVYARVAEPVVPRYIAKYSDVIVDKRPNDQYWGGAQSNPGNTMALITGFAWLLFASLLGSGPYRDFLP